MGRRRWRAAPRAGLLLLAALWGCKSAPQTSVAARAEAPRVVELHDLCWSGGGRELFFSARSCRADHSDESEKNWNVYRYELDSRTLVCVVPGALGVACEPRGTRIAVARLAGATRDLFVLDRDGKELLRLTLDPEDEQGPSWSADGKQLAYELRTGGKVELFVAEIGGLGPRRLSSSPGACQPSWSPDGKQIAYCLASGEGKSQIWLMNADGTDPHALTHDALEDVSPGWLPDGRIVYASGIRGGPSHIVTIKADGGEMRPVPGLDAECARFSRDGSKVAYFGREPVLVIAAADGTRIDRLPFETIAATPTVRP